MTSPNRSVIVRLAMEPSSYIAGASKAAAATTALNGEVAKVGGTTATSMERAAKSASATEGVFGKLNKTAGTLGFTLGGLAGIGAGVGVALSVKWAGDYQQSLTKLATTAGESQKNLHMVGQGMLDMAGQVGIGADELAKGMYTVESSGIHGANALVVLKAAAQGAKQENADLTKVTDAVTTALHDYNLPASDAAKVTSMLVTAVSHGKTTFDELTGAMHSVTPLAAALHVPLSDIAGTLSAMTASGESADQAAQNMADTLRHLQSPTSTMTNELGQLGITSSDLATQLSTKGLSGTLQGISEAILTKIDPATQKVLLPAFNQSKTAAQDLTIMIGHMPPALAKLSQSLLDGATTQGDYRKAAQALGGQAGVLGDNFLSLYKTSDGFNSIIKQGGPAAQVYTAALQKAVGTSAGLTVALQVTGEHAATTNAAIKDIAKSAGDAQGNIKGWAEVQGNFNQQVSQAEAHLKSMAIEAGQHLLPALTGAFGYVNRDVLPALEHLGSAASDAVHWFSGLPAPLKDTALALGALAAANKIGVFSALESGASKLVSGLGGIASGAKGAVTSLSGLKAAGTGVMNFFGGPVVLGVAAVTAAFVASSDEIDNWAKALEQGGRLAQTAAQQMQDAHDRSILDAHSVKDAWGIVSGAFADGLAQLEGYSSASDKASQKAKDWYNALSPTQKLSQDVTVDQNNLNDAVDKYGKGSQEAKYWAWQLNLALGDQQTHQQDVDSATRGTNGALQDQIGLQRQLSQAGVSLDQAQLSAKQSIDQYKSSLKDANLTEQDRQRALDDVSQSIFGVMDAAKQKADAETKGLPQTLITNQEIVRQRDALQQVVDKLGFVPPALQGMYDSLNGPTAKALQAAQTNVNGLGTAMTTVTTNDAPGMQKALNDLATAAGTTFPQAVTGGFLPAAKGAGDVAVITAGQVGQAKDSVDGVVRSLLGVPQGTDTSNKALNGANGWFGTVAGSVDGLIGAIRGIPTVNIQADATQANNTIDAFLQKVQSQGFVGAIWNINPIGGSGGTGGNLPGLPPIPHRAGGGIIPGPRTAVRDNVLGLSGSGMPTARVEPGEFVVNADQTAKNRALLEGINAGLIGLAGGGYVLPTSLNYPVDAGQGLLALVQREAKAAMTSAQGWAPGAPANVSANAALGRQMAAQYGWTGAEWNALFALGQRESGWNNNAQNPTSTAYGIPQFLNSTWASVGLSKTSSPVVQIAGMLKYIQQRYRDPLGAWGHETKFGWYHNGGTVQGPIGADVPAVLRVGETVRTAEQEQSVQQQLRSREVGGTAGGAGLAAALREAMSGASFGDFVGLAVYGDVHTDPDELARRATQRSRRLLSAAGVKV